MNQKQKIKQLRDLLKKHDANQIIIKSQDPNFFWITQQNSEGATLIIKKEETILLKKPLEGTPKINLKEIKIIPLKKRAEEQEICKKIIKGKTLINYEKISVAEIKNLNIKKTKNISKELQEIRATKTDNEIQKIKTACNHTVKCWNILIKKINKELKTETQIANFIKKYALEKELELAFNPVVASGKNAGVPHHEPRGKLKKGFLIVDFGFTYKGYKSDMTRTLYLGKPTKQERQIYNELLKVQEQMIQKTKKLKNAKELYKEILKIMKKPELFIHGLGHGVGVEIHEKPSISKDSEDTIKKRNIITIEPGYYTKKYGIRIEDTILIKEKPIILTKTSKKLKIIQ